jgi:hypothetical protein
VIVDQPPPADSTGPRIIELVRDDFAERERLGIERYGKPLRPFSTRDPLTDAYQECLDMAAYLRQAIYERDGE